VISETATSSHLASGMLKSELRSMNPMFLLNNKYLMKMKGFYFDTLGASRSGESAEQVIIAMPNRNNTRINLLLAEGLEANPNEFTGNGVTLLTSMGNEDREKADHLMIENIGEAKTSLRDFSQMIEKKVWTINNDHLTMPFLMIRLKDEKESLEESIREERPLSEQRQIKRSINRCYTEIFRRISLAMSVFTFTLMGAAFGVSISRQRSNKGVIYIICLATLFLVTYFTAKGMDHILSLPAALYFVPHILIIALSVWTLNRVSRGIE
jgi:lipopolysaccharide export system permease protein